MSLGLPATRSGVDDSALGGAGQFRRAGSMLLGYARIRPERLEDALRLYRCFAEAGLCLCTKPRTFRHVGEFLRGRGYLKVNSAGSKFLIRPGTEDLGVVTGRHRPFEVGSDWFNPRAGETFVDVGSSIGFYSVMAARRGAKVLSIEPNPDTFQTLSRNLLINGLGGVSAQNLAVSSRAGSAPLYLPPFGTGLASLQPDWVVRTGSPESVPVRLETLDTLTGGLPEVDWMMIDVEGHEADVLAGATRTLARTRRLVIEVSRGAAATSCKLLIQQAGLSIEKIHLLPESRNDYWLAVRAQSRPNNP